MRYAYKFMRKSTWMNIFIIIQLSVVLSAIIFIVSAYLDRLSYYKPFEPYLSKNGIVVISALVNDYALEATGHKGTEMVKMYTNTETVDENEDTFYTNGYSADLLNSLNIKLVEGKMPDTSNTENPQCLISVDTKYKVGDKITLTDTYNNKQLTLTISGIIADNQRLPAITTDYSINGNFQDLYAVYNHNDTISFDSENGAIPYNLVITTDTACSNAGFNMFYNSGVSIINYPKYSYTETEYNDFLETNDIDVIKTTEEYNKESKDYLTRELYNISPILFCVLLLTLFTSITTNAICARRNLRNYAVLYLCGSTWKKCSKISLNFSCIISAFSIILTALFILIGKNTFLKDTVVSIDYWQLGICGGVIVFYILLSMIIPMIIVRKNEPRDILKDK